MNKMNSKNSISKTLTGVIISLVLLSSCYKEDYNSKPEVFNITVDKDTIYPGDTVKLYVNADDPDGDPLYFNVSSSFGTITSNPLDNPILYIPPYIEGTNYIDIEINDGKVKTNTSTEVNVFSYVYDNFNHYDNNWTESKCNVSYANGEATVVSIDTISDAIYYFDLHDKISPPYAVHMDISMDDLNSLSSADKYGMYLNFQNVGADTTIKALWFRIYPLSTVKNWKVSVYKDKGSSNSWVNLDTASIGTSTLINTNEGIVNSLKLVVETDNTLNIYVGNQLLYSTTTLATEYLSGGQPPKLILERIGARTSAGSITLDNVFVSHKTNQNSSELFK